MKRCGKALSRIPYFARCCCRTQSTSFSVEVEIGAGKISLRQTIYATIGYEKLGALMGKTPDDIKRMCHPDYDTSVNDLFEIIGHVQRHEGVRLEVRVCSGEADCESVVHDAVAEVVEEQQPLQPVSSS